MPKADHPLPLVPPRRTSRLPGRFRWPALVTLASTRDADMLPLAQLAEDLRAQKRRTRIRRDAVGPAQVRVRRDVAVPGAEAYRLLIRPEGIEISAATDAGAYYGVQTLRELVRAGGATLGAARLEDAPDVARRAVYYDCSRGKVPAVDTLKLLVEQLAHWKINELQLYIENVFAFQRHPAIGRGFDPFSVDDILDLQAHAARHHVRFVPSLAGFGHMECTLALPAYRGLGERPGTNGKPGGTTLCPGDPRSLRLVEDLYNEFLPLFTADDFNACGDEPWELGKGRSRRRAEQAGVGTVYLDFVLKLHRLCEHHGKRMNLWADIVLQHPDQLPRVPRDMVMLNWEYAASGGRMDRTHEIAAAGLSLMVCPGTHAWQAHGTRLPEATQNVRRFAALGRRHGAEGLLMTDWGDLGHRQAPGVSLRAFAHAAAHAWNGRAVEEESFTTRFCRTVLGGDAPDAVETLEQVGRTYLAAGDPSGLYHGLVEPLDPRTDLYRGIPRRSPVWIAPVWRHRIDGMAREGLEAVVERLGALRPPAPPRNGEFAATLLLEGLALARRQDWLAATRALCIKRARAGERVPAAEWRRTAREVARLSEALAAQWMNWHRPSRLRDNQRLLANVAAADAARGGRPR